MKHYLKFFTASIVIMLMSIAGSMALHIDVLPCAAVLTAGSVLISFLPQANFSFLETVVPPLLTKEILLAELNTMKDAVIATLTDKNKAEIEAQVKEKTDEIEARIAEIKALPPTATAAELKAVSDDLAVTIKAVDKLQIILKRTNAPVNPELKSFDQRVLEAVENATDDIVKFKKGDIKKFALEIKAVGAVGTNNVTGTTIWGAQRRQEIIMNPNTMTHARDLIQVINAGPGTDYYFMYENGNGEGSIAATAEASSAATPTTQATGLKPQFDLDLVEASVKFEIIAGWMLMSRKAMNNIPGFASFLQRRLPVKLMDAEDSYILYGTGTTPQIKGILTSGNYTASTSSDHKLIERIIDDMSLLEDTYKRLATGIAMRPSDYYSFFKNKATGSGEYDLPQGVFFQNGILYILGVPVAKTTALIGNDYVVGDFQNGTELLIQEGMRLEFFEQDSTNVRTNQITVRIEETAALPVFGSNYFIKGSSAGVDS